MHEWALAESIILTIVEEAKNSARNSFEVEVVVGELQAIDLEVFEFALNELKTVMEREHGISVKSLKIVKEQLKFKCNRCGFVWGLADIRLSDDVKEAVHFVPEVIHSYVQCPKCYSHDFEIVSGRGVSMRFT
jgi:hydrogenase nickel incorporation protein HypA/HybF